MQFNKEIGLPICFDEIGIKEDEFDVMVEKAITSTEWKFRPKDVAREKFMQCMIEQNKVTRCASSNTVNLSALKGAESPYI